MNYRVDIPDEVRAAILAQAEYLLDQGASRKNIGAWLKSLEAAISSLDTMPKRCGISTLVSAQLHTEVRRLNHGEYAVYFTVDDAEQRVLVLAFRHAKRLPLGE